MLIAFTDERRAATRAATSSPGPATSSPPSGTPSRAPTPRCSRARSTTSARADVRAPASGRSPRRSSSPAPLIAAGLGVGLAFRAGTVQHRWPRPDADRRRRRRLGRLHVRPAAGHPPDRSRSSPAWSPARCGRGIAGLLKARTGAHEVIVTIMLNYVAFYLVFCAARARRACCRRPARATRSRRR